MISDLLTPDRIARPLDHYLLTRAIDPHDLHEMALLEVVVLDKSHTTEGVGATYAMYLALMPDYEFL